MSIVQGGSGFPVFLPGVYHYLTTGEYLGVIPDSQVPDTQVRQLLLQVSNTVFVRLTVFKYYYLFSIDRECRFRCSSEGDLCRRRKSVASIRDRLYTVSHCVNLHVTTK